MIVVVVLVVSYLIFLIFWFFGFLVFWFLFFCFLSVIVSRNPLSVDFVLSYQYCNCFEFAPIHSSGSTTVSIDSFLIEYKLQHFVEPFDVCLARLWLHIPTTITPSLPYFFTI